MEASSIVVLLKLMFAHILSDFVFQTKGMVEKKSERNLGFHLLHAFIHAGLSYVILFEWALWYVPITIFITHLLIDYFKTYCKDESLKMKMFIADQSFHLVVIIALWLCVIPYCDICAMITILQQNQQNYWAYMLGVVLLLKPSSMLIANFTDKWQNNTKLGLQNAGLWIGYFERLLIFAFITMNWYEGIGFLLAAKSIFRFGELKNEDLKTTEYVLIGTFASFLIAVSVGLMIKLSI